LKDLAPSICRQRVGVVNDYELQLQL
jgi:hypothetical protein